MAINDYAPNSGVIQRCQTSAGASVGNVVGGAWEINGGITRDDAIGMQASSHSGIVTATFNADLQLPTVAIMSDVIRASATHSVAAKSFHVGDAAAEWVYTSCQPTGLSVRGAVGEALQANVGMMALTPSQTEVGGSQASSGGISTKWSDWTCSIDSTDYGIQSFDISVDTGAYVVSSLGTASSTTKRLPVAVRLANQTVDVSVTTYKQIPAASSSIVADTYDEDIDALFICGGVTFTLSDLGTPVETGSFEAGGGLVLYSYAFPAVIQLGSLTIAAT